MIELIKQFEEELDDVGFKGVAQYGLEAALPSGKGLVSMALENEIMRRNVRTKRIYEYINKVNFINTNRQKVKDKREIEVLDYLLDGESLAAIRRYMGIGARQVNKMRSDIVDLLVED